jgi:hypothetical protein
LEIEEEKKKKEKFEKSKIVAVVTKLIQKSRNENCK